MQGRKLTETEIRRIEEAWAEDPIQSGRAVFRKLLERGEPHPSERKVIEIVSSAKRRGLATPAEPLTGNQWNPWDEKWSPEERGFLFNLERHSLIYNGAHLSDDVARWAVKLRFVLQGAHPSQQLGVAYRYLTRERLALTLGYDKPRTQDLDGELAFGIFPVSLFGLNPDNQKMYLYQLAVIAKLVDRPPSPEGLKVERERAFPELTRIWKDALSEFGSEECYVRIGALISQSLATRGEAAIEAFMIRVQIIRREWKHKSFEVRIQEVEELLRAIVAQYPEVSETGNSASE